MGGKRGGVVLAERALLDCIIFRGVCMRTSWLSFYDRDMVLATSDKSRNTSHLKARLAL